MATPKQIASLERLYARLPRIECRRQCQAYCGVVFMSRPEWERIVGRLGHEPKGDASLACPMLEACSGKCRVYDIRPMICRLWGLTKDMKCPHGCVPSRWLSEKECRAFLAKAEKLEQGVEV